MRHRYFLRFASILLVTMGCILLFSPKEWFPNFYSPVFMGTVALISPVLIYLPKWILQKGDPKKRKLILEMRSVIAFALLINFAGELGLFQLYRIGFEYDKFSHSLVSMMFAFILGESLKEWEHFSLRKRMLIVFLVVFGAGIFWEFFEASSDFLFKTQEWGVYGQHLVLDTLKDIGFNTLGAIAGIAIFMIPNGTPKNHSR